MNITYLIGAGASYNALPILSEMPKRLQYLSLELEGQTSHFRTPEEQLSINRIIKDLNWLIGEVRNHQTIDTFAKKLFLNSKYHDDLKRFKALLTIYFLYEQTFEYAQSMRKEAVNKKIEGLIDKRYDSFIASLISNQIDKYELNPTVKILSWNYDSQVEIAYKKFKGTEISVEETQKHLQLIRSRSVGNIKVDLTKFAVIKLNGTASFYYNENYVYDWIAPTSSYDEYYHKLIMTYEEALKRHDLIEIRYAWESEHEDNNPFYTDYSNVLKQNINLIANQTDILVVIGYSFPIFNRKVDKEIIDSMTHLKKIYIQDYKPNRIVSLLTSSFNLERNALFAKYDIEIIAEENIDAFLLPPELN